MWKRSLVAMGVMIGASALFVAATTLVSLSLVDRAISPTGAPADRTDNQGLVTNPHGANQAPDHPTSAKARPGGGRS